MTESGKEVDIKNCDMSEEMKQKAIEIAKQALEKYAIVTHCNLSYIAKKHRFRYQRESDATFINILLTLQKNIHLGINVNAMWQSLSQRHLTRNINLKNGNALLDESLV